MGQEPRVARGTTAALSAGVFMASLDLFIVNLALPSIRDDFGGPSLSKLSWALTAYAVVFAGTLVPLGRWADRVGRRRGYITGLFVFCAASAAAAAANTADVLIAARALQAVGAALIVPTSLSLLLATVPPARRAAAIGAWAAASAVAAASGPVLGGLLVELSWRWVFLVNLPIGAAAAVLALRLLPESREPAGGPRADLTGAALLTAGTSLLALVLVQADPWGLSSPRTAAAAAAIALFVAFARRTRRHPSPVVDPALLRSTPFAAANAASLLFYAAFAAMLLALVLFMSSAWQYTPVRAGLAIAPGPLTVLVVARRLAPRLIAARGPSAAALTGTAAFAVGFALWAATWGPDPAYAAEMLPGLILTGLGVGLLMPATIVAGSAGCLPSGSRREAPS